MAHRTATRPPGATGPATSAARAAAVAAPGQRRRGRRRGPGRGRGRPDGQGRSAAGTRSPPPPPTDGRTDGADRLAGLVSVDRRHRLVTGAGRHDRCTRSTPMLAAHGLAMPNLGDIDAQTIAGALATGTHGTGAGYGCLSTFVEALDAGHRHRRGAALLRRRATRTSSRAARVGVGALGVVTEVTLRCVDAFILRADERPTPLADVLASLRRARRRQRPLRVLLVPVHRPGADQAQQPGAGRRPAAVAGCRGWLDDDFLANTVFGGACRLGRAVPALTPTISCGRRAGALRRAPTPTAPTWSSARRAGSASWRWSTACPAPPCPRRSPALRRDHRRAAVQGALPGRGAVHRRRRHLAVARVRAGQRVHRHPPVRRHAVRAVLPGASRRSATPLGGRPHWGKLHYRDAGVAAPGVPALRRLPGACATSSTRTGSSPTPTPTRSSAPDPLAAARPTGPRCRSADAVAFAGVGLLRPARSPSSRRPSSRRRLLGGGLLRGGLLRRGLLRGRLLGRRAFFAGGLLRAPPSCAAAGPLARFSASISLASLDGQRLERLAAPQRRVGLAVGHVRAEPAVLDHQRLLGDRVVAHLAQRRRGGPALPRSSARPAAPAPRPG